MRAPAVERLDGLPPADLVLFCVKSFDTEEAAALIRPVVGPDTGVLSIQNGVDNEEKLARVLGAGHVLGGAVRVFATIEAPGRHPRTPSAGTSPSARWTGARRDARAGLPRRVPEGGDPGRARGRTSTRALWEKYVFLTTHAGMTALTRCPAGVLRAVPEVREMYRRIVDRDRRGRARPPARRLDDATARAGLEVPRHGGPERVLVAAPRPDPRQAARARGPPRPRGAARPSATACPRPPSSRSTRRSARIGTARPPLPRASGAVARPGWRRARLVYTDSVSSLRRLLPYLRRYRLRYLGGRGLPAPRHRVLARASRGR